MLSAILCRQKAVPGMKKDMHGRVVFLLAGFVLASPCTSSADAADSAQPTQQQDAQQRNAALLDHAEKMAARNETLMTRAEAHAARVEVEAKRMDAVLAKWEAQQRSLDTVLSRSDERSRASWLDARAVIAGYVPLIALFFVVLNYRRKAGVLVRGEVELMSSRACDDKYVSRVIFENLKDRAITVFGIYLRVGHNYYIKLEDFEDKPMLLKAYESYHMEYGPIQFYGINRNRINLNQLLDDTKVSKRLVLSTSDGKYVVPKTIPRWNPVLDYFRNYMTANVHPVRTTYKGTNIGGRIKYVVEVFSEDGASVIAPLWADDFRKFQAITLTRESLETAETLNLYLTEQRKNGKLTWHGFTVHDANAWRELAGEFYSGQHLEAKYCGFFEYHILGRLWARLSSEK
jgi:hypothetical protein